MQRRTFLSLAAAAPLAPAVPAATTQAEPEMRLLLDRRQIESIAGAELSIAPSIPHPNNPATIDGRVIWTKNNVHASIFRDASGQYYGWRLQTVEGTTENRVMLPVRSPDGMQWTTTGEPMDFEGAVFRDNPETDSRRRYKMIHHGWAEFDTAGGLRRYLNRATWIAEGGLENRALIRAIFSATSPDGRSWPERHVVVQENHLQHGKRWWTP